LYTVGGRRSTWPGFDKWSLANGDTRVLELLVFWSSSSRDEGDREKLRELIQEFCNWHFAKTSHKVGRQIQIPAFFGLHHVEPDSRSRLDFIHDAVTTDLLSRGVKGIEEWVDARRVRPVEVNANVALVASAGKQQHPLPATAEVVEVKGFFVEQGPSVSAVVVNPIALTSIAARPEGVNKTRSSRNMEVFDATSLVASANAEVVRPASWPTRLAGALSLKKPHVHAVAATPIALVPRAMEELERPLLHPSNRGEELLSEESRVFPTPPTGPPVIETV
jgi:hypothetical protein